LFQLGTFFTLTGITCDRSRRDVASTFLEGTALDWFISVATTIDTFTTFSINIMSHFSPLEPLLNARAKLRDCAQVSTVEAYITVFRSIALLVTDLSPAEKLDKFLFGLKKTVRTEVIIRGASTFEAAADIAARYEAASTMANAPSPSYSSSTTTTQPPRPPARLAAITSTTPRVPLTPALRSELAAKGACFYCRQTGHAIADCPIRPARQGNGAPQ
jgi:hypothetical protein